MSNASWDAAVRQFATMRLVSVLPDTPVAEIQALLEREDISAVPIVDRQGVLCGIFSTTDLLRIARIEMESPRALARVWLPPHRVSDVMRKEVVAVDENASLREAATKMLERRIHRVVVTRHASPVGILGTRDAMRAILAARVMDPLSQVMTTDLQTIALGETIDVAIGQLTDANVHGIVVVDGSWPVGVFTQREALKARALPHVLRQGPVEQVMSYETICHDVSTPLYRIAGQSIEMNVRRILAVDSRRLVGIATGFDLLRVMRA